MQDKAELRTRLRQVRRDHASSLPSSMRGLVFRRPPAPLLERIAPDATIGLYCATPHEAPAGSFVSFFFERGHTIALPRFPDRAAPMVFVRHRDPFGGSDLEVGPFGLLQPFAGAELVTPDVIFLPLLGFTSHGDRLGQGGGHYDRWLAEHPDTLSVGLAWDVQLCDSLPIEPHDRRLDAVITPTRFFGPF